MGYAPVVFAPVGLPPRSPLRYAPELDAGGPLSVWGQWRLESATSQRSACCQEGWKAMPAVSTPKNGPMVDPKVIGVT